MYYKEAANLLVGDRELPLEADLDADIDNNHPLIGKSVEVSPASSGTMKKYIGEKATVVGVLRRYGDLVGLQVLLGGKKKFGPLKNFYIDRTYLENIQPPTAGSVEIRETLNRYATQNTYWLEYVSGIESFCFDLATCAPACLITPMPTGFVVNVPTPKLLDITTIVGTVIRHTDFYTLGSMVFPRRVSKRFEVQDKYLDHWQRTFHYAETICGGLLGQGFPWEKSLRNLNYRKEMSKKVLIPLLKQELSRVKEAKKQLTGEEPNITPEDISIGFSRIRLKPNTVGLNEPPTDRRPYSVISVSPKQMGDMEYLQQIVLHECIHVCVQNIDSKDPHNEEFHEIAEMLDLSPEYRD